MNTINKYTSIFQWAARIISILFILFLSVFAIDVFDGHGSFGKTAVALLMHLLPALIVMMATIIAWKWQPVGAILFFLLGIVYIIAGRRNLDWTSYALISGPLFLIGFLYLLAWKSAGSTIKKTGW